MRTIQERLAPFDRRELERDTEFVHPWDAWCESRLKDAYEQMLEVLFPDGDYDDTYDCFPAWEAKRLPKGCGYFDRKDRRSSVVTKRNSKFISKTKENK